MKCVEKIRKGQCSNFLIIPMVCDSVRKYYYSNYIVSGWEQEDVSDSFIEEYFKTLTWAKRTEIL